MSNTSRRRLVSLWLPFPFPLGDSSSSNSDGRTHLVSNTLGGPRGTPEETLQIAIFSSSSSSLPLPPFPLDEGHTMWLPPQTPSIGSEGTDEGRVDGRLLGA